MNPLLRPLVQYAVREKAPALWVPLFGKNLADSLTLSALDSLLGGPFSEALKNGSLKGHPGEVAWGHYPRTTIAPDGRLVTASLNILTIGLAPGQNLPWPSATIEAIHAATRVPLGSPWTVSCTDFCLETAAPLNRAYYGLAGIRQPSEKALKKSQEFFTRAFPGLSIKIIE